MNRDRPEWERRQATILFADLSGFVSMSEKLDTEEVAVIMGDCFNLLGRIVAEHGGVIDKFIGDCVMAVFGVPKALEGAPRKAISAAIAMRSALDTFTAARSLSVSLGIHIGINTGEVLYGELGSEEKKDLTVMGDAVNIASRLKDQADRGRIYVGPLTWRFARGLFHFIPLRPVSVKGKSEPVQAYEVTGGLSAEMNQAAAVPGLSAMVGREAEFHRLSAQAVKLLAGEGSVVNIVGEAGIGKSRLCAELLAKDFMKEIGVLEGRASSAGRTLAFLPVIGILKNWASISADEGEEPGFIKLEAAIRAVMAEEADEAIPFIATLMGYRLKGAYADRLEGVKGESLGKIIAKYIRDLIVKAAESSPVLIVLEDLHWTDESTLELLKSIAPLAAKHPVMILCVWRPGYGDTVGKLHNFLRESLSERVVDIELNPLEEAQSLALALNLARNAGFSERTIGRIVKKSGGNPFFIEEVVRSLIENAPKKARKVGSAANGDPEAIQIPNSIDAVIMSRVDRLEEESRELLRIASVIGRSFFLRILSRIAESGEALYGRMETLKGLQLIVERTRIGETEYLFNHVLVQETIYGSLLLRTRKLLHVKVARAVEEMFADRLPEFYGVLAFHYSQGEDMDKAEEYLEKAGKAALESAASSEALVFLQRALAIYLRKKKDDHADADRIAMYEEAIARACWNIGYHPEAVDHFDAALRNYGYKAKSGFGKYLGAFFGWLSILRYFYFPLTRSMREPNESEKNIIRIMMDRLWAVISVDTTEAMLFGLSIVSRFNRRNHGDSRGNVRIFCDIAQFASSIKPLGRTVRKMLEHIGKRVRTEVERYEFQDAEIWYAFASGCRVQAYDEKLVDYFVSKGEFPRVTQYLVRFGQIAVYTGEFAEAERIAKKALDIADEYQNEASRTVYWELVVQIRIMRKEVPEAQEAANALLALSLKLGVTTLRKLFLSFQLDASVPAGDHRETAKTAAEITALLQSEKIHVAIQAVPSLIALARYYVRRSEEADTRSLKRIVAGDAAPIIKELRKSGSQYPYRYPEACRVLGDWYRLRAKSGTALRFLRKGLRAAGWLNLKPELGRINYEIANLLAEPGRRRALNGNAASVYALRARALFVELGLEADLRELDEREGEGRSWGLARPADNGSN